MSNAVTKLDSHSALDSQEIAKVPVQCPVCDGSQYTVRYEPTVQILDPVKLYGAASGVTGTQRLVVCSDCGCLYENPRYPEDVIIRGYSSANDAGHDAQHSMRVNSFLAALNSLRSKIPGSGARVLDIGTAGGAFLDAAKLYGYNAAGIEPSAYLVARAKERGLEVYEGTTNSVTFPVQSFDMICLWDVLEHVVNPKELLRTIRPWLKPNGTLLINYPDIGTWQAKLFGKRFWWLLSVHIQHFSPRSIRRVCELSGYSVFSVVPYWQTLQFGYLVGIARHLGVPGAGLIEKILPKAIAKIPVKYYASQTTALARPN